VAEQRALFVLIGVGDPQRCQILDAPALAGDELVDGTGEPYTGLTERGHVGWQFDRQKLLERDESGPELIEFHFGLTQLVSPEYAEALFRGRLTIG
jgi:hypothetical protein